MVDQGKHAALRARDPRPGTASDDTSHALDSNADESLRSSAKSAPRGGLNDQTRTRLAAQLRTMYDSITQQPVPDRFAELIAKLDSSDRGKI